jgi:hypothetical protein
MLQNLNEEIRNALPMRRNAGGCRKPFTPCGIKNYLDRDQRWLNQARSYEFAERLSNFTKPFRGRNPHEK